MWGARTGSSESASGRPRSSWGSEGGLRRGKGDTRGFLPSPVPRPPSRVGGTVFHLPLDARRDEPARLNVLSVRARGGGCALRALPPAPQARLRRLRGALGHLGSREWGVVLDSPIRNSKQGREVPLPTPHAFAPRYCAPGRRSPVWEPRPP